jgi:hypothetical protein
MSRRGRDLTIQIPIKKCLEPIHLVVDSTGLKIYGEGEWKIRKHRKNKHYQWVKVHLGVDANEKDVLGSEVTTEDYSDSEMFESLDTHFLVPVYHHFNLLLKIRKFVPELLPCIRMNYLDIPKFVLLGTVLS